MATMPCTTLFHAFSTLSLLICSLYLLVPTSEAITRSRTFLTSIIDAYSKLGKSKNAFLKYLEQYPDADPALGTKYSVLFREVQTDDEGKKEESVVKFRAFGRCGDTDDKWEMFEEQASSNLYRHYIPEEQLSDAQRKLWMSVKQKPRLLARYKNPDVIDKGTSDKNRQFTVHFDEETQKVIGYETMDLHPFDTINEAVETTGEIQLINYADMAHSREKLDFHRKFDYESLRRGKGTSQPNSSLRYSVLFYRGHAFGYVVYGPPSGARPSNLAGKNGAGSADYFLITQPPVLFSDVNQKQVRAVRARLAKEFAAWVRGEVTRSKSGYGLMLHTLDENVAKWVGIFDKSLTKLYDEKLKTPEDAEHPKWRYIDFV